MKKSKFNIAAKTLLILLTAVTLCSLIPVNARGSSEHNIQCSSSKAYAVYLYNLEKDDVLFDQNSDKKISPASTVKLMTAIVAYEAIKDIESYAVISDSMISGVAGNSMKLSAGEHIKIKDLFIGLVCGGYNDAATALAVIAGGSLDSFVLLMNEKAEALGMVNTVYTDPTGIDDSAQTTAYDTLLIAKEFISNSFLLESSSLPSYEIPKTDRSDARTVHNRNAMISNHTGSKYLNSNAIGMNSGMTSGGGYCLVTCSKRDDMTYICIVMGGTYEKENDTVYSYVIANELVNYVSVNLGYRTLYESGDKIGTIPVVGANIKTENVSIVIAEDVKVYLPVDYSESGLFKTTFVYYKNKLNAPIKSGTVVGSLVVSYGDEILEVCDIVTAEDIERDSFMYSLEVMRRFISSRFLISSVICFAVILTVYLIFHSRSVSAIRRKRRYKKRYRY